MELWCWGLEVRKVEVVRVQPDVTVSAGVSGHMCGEVLRVLRFATVRAQVSLRQVRLGYVFVMEGWRK